MFILKTFERLKELGRPGYWCDADVAQTGEVNERGRGMRRKGKKRNKRKRGGERKGKETEMGAGWTRKRGKN